MGRKQELQTIHNVFEIFISIQKYTRVYKWSLLFNVYNDGTLYNLKLFNSFYYLKNIYTFNIIEYNQYRIISQNFHRGCLRSSVTSLWLEFVFLSGMM